MQFPAAVPERPSLVRPESSDCFRTSTLLWGRREAKWRRIRVSPSTFLATAPARPPPKTKKNVGEEDCGGDRGQEGGWKWGREGEKKLFFQALIPPKGGSRAEEGTILFSHG